MAIFHAWTFQIQGGKWPFSMLGLFKFGVENDHFPGLDFSNSGWKMAIFHAWTFRIRGGKWPFSMLGLLKFRAENGHFPCLDF